MIHILISVVFTGSDFSLPERSAHSCVRYIALCHATLVGMYPSMTFPLYRETEEGPKASELTESRVPLFEGYLTYMP